MTIDDLSGLIRQLNIQDDAIVMDSKIRDLADLFHAALDDHQQLSDIFERFNRLALADEHFAINMAVFFASRVLDSVLQSGSEVRAEMCTVLEQNFTNADALKAANPQHFHNSITLLGEYYHRVRVAASPVAILGQSLLQLLTVHLRADIDRHLHDAAHRPDARFAKLILRQLTLNGPLARRNHRQECDDLLFECRRCLVLVGGAVCTETRALLLMTLDLYYANFGRLGGALEELYVTYLMEDEPSLPTQPTVIGVQAHSAPETAASSIAALRGEMAREASGYQRPTGNMEYLARPKNARDRLKFVRAQTAAELERDSQVFAERQRAFEATVQQQQQQPRQLTAATMPQSPGRLSQPTPAQPLLPSPIKQYVNTASVQQAPPMSPSHINVTSTATVPSPRSSKSCASPRTPRSTGTASATPSAHSSPAKTPLSGRRPRPLVAPVSPPQNSDWYAECMSSFDAGVQQAQRAQHWAADRAEVVSSSSASQSLNTSGGSAAHNDCENVPTTVFGQGSIDWNNDDWKDDGDNDWNSYDSRHGDAGDENRQREPQPPTPDLQPYQNGNNGPHRRDGAHQPMSPSKHGSQRGGNGGRRNGGNNGNGNGAGNGGGGRRNHRSRNGQNGDARRGHDRGADDNDSKYASKTSLHSSASFRRGADAPAGGHHEDRHGSSNQLKPANRNNPFDRRPASQRQPAASKSRHDQHCDRGETGNDRRYGNNGSGGHHNGYGGGGRDHSPASNGRHSAAHINKEFLQFLDD